VGFTLLDGRQAQIVLEADAHLNQPTIDLHYFVMCRYSANPDEKVLMFDEEMKALGLPVLKKGLASLENALSLLECILFNTDQIVPPAEQPPNTTLLNTSYGKTSKNLKNLLKDVIIHINMLGLFGGSQACLAHIIQLQRLRKKVEDKLTKDVFTTLIVTLMSVR
jgi:hypothetical protein